MNYQEHQKGGVIVIALIIALLVIVAGFFMNLNEIGNTSLGFFLVTMLFLAIFALFGSMKTGVTSSEIKLTFGVGIIKKTILLHEVKAVTVVRNKWFYGWGIRYYGKGWMWNFSGLDAVELEFKNRKMRFRIGSGNAENLKLAIQSNIT